MLARFHRQLWPSTYGFISLPYKFLLRPFQGPFLHLCHGECSSISTILANPLALLPSHFSLFSFPYPPFFFLSLSFPLLGDIGPLFSPPISTLTHSERPSHKHSQFLFLSLHSFSPLLSSSPPFFKNFLFCFPLIGVSCAYLLPARSVLHWGLEFPRTLTTIEPMFLSDHHPISCTLTFPETEYRTKTWKLNPSLLKDPDNLSRLKWRIQLYFAENDTPDISLISLWEAHKCVIRGELLALAAAAKRKCQEMVEMLIVKIHRLETFHKHSQSQKSLQDLLHTWSLLLEELGKPKKCWYVLRQKIFYEHGNKSGRLLARAVQTSRTSLTIHHIHDQHGTLHKNLRDTIQSFIT